MDTNTASQLTDETLRIPAGLRKGQKAADVILAVLRADDQRDTGGCRAFYSPAEWKRRGEAYGTKSLLVVVHDDGDLYKYFSYMSDSPTRRERMERALDAAGFRVEPCTVWYSAVYEK